MTLLLILSIIINFILLYYILFVLKRPLLDDYDDYYIEQRDIKESNKILFYKLKKQYLNKVTYDDICDLIYFLEEELKDRRNKYENTI